MTRRRRVLPPAVRAAMLAHARTEAPRECCGLLLGRRTRVQFALPMQNVAARPMVEFRLDDREHITVRRMLRRLKPSLEIVGAYHSHPRGGGKPSPSDIAGANYPDWLYAIVAIGRRRSTVGLFRIVKQRVQRV